MSPRLIDLADLLTETEIYKVDLFSIFVQSKEYVRWFDIVMDEAGLMQHQYFTD